MDKKLAHKFDKELYRNRQEQDGHVMSLVTLSMAGARHRHVNTNQRNDQFSVERLERDVTYMGKRHARTLNRCGAFYESFAVSNFTPMLQAALKPYEGYIGVVDSDTSFHAVRVTPNDSEGHKVDRWHYSITIYEDDLYPSWINFSSLRGLCGHLALRALLREEITREQFIMFCSDVLSSTKFLALNKDIAQNAKP